MTLIESDQCPDSAMPDPDFVGALDRYRHELHVHCYRMVGSYTDAEDLVQETLVRAWRHRADFEEGTNLRAWLYRIATNVCLDAIRARGRQIGRGGSQAEATWLEPYPDVVLDQVADAAAGPESAAVARETVELAFVAAIQALPPRQRAVLVLSAGLGWSPSETANVLDLSLPAVNSALQRARATLRRRLPEDSAHWTTPSLDDEERETLRRFIEMHERGDAAAVAALMRDDIVATMPPEPRLLRGKEAVAPLLDVAFGATGMGTWRLVPVGANRQPAAASYLRRPGAARYHAFKLDVLRVVGGQVAETTTFDAGLFGAFGLPDYWSEGLRAATFARYGMGR
jgi:RNA polymerase sigma-70 factor (TIGR02960 family)